jgi:CDGSH-type Zn-finger protein
LKFYKRNRPKLDFSLIIKKQTTIPMCRCGKKALLVYLGEWFCDDCHKKITRKIKRIKKESN